MLTNEDDFGVKKMRGLMLLARRDEIIKLKNIGISDKDISKFIGCLEYAIKIFTVNFLVEKDGTYYAKQYGVSDIIVKIDYIVGRLKEKDLNKQEAYDILVAALQSNYGGHI
jgi:hypothetical protein